MNNIVGKSADHNESLTVIESINKAGAAIQAISNQLSNHEKRLSKVEDTMRVNGIQELKITNAVNARVISWLGGKDSNAYENRSLRGKAYASINRELKRLFGVPRRAEIPAKDFDEAMKVINEWKLDKDLLMEVEHNNNQLTLLEAN